MDLRSLSVHAVAALGTALLALCLLIWTPLSSFENQALDALLRTGSNWPPTHPAEIPDAVVAALDTRSLNAFDDWPWPRNRYARLIEVLEAAEVRAITFDIDFSTPRDPKLDAEFGTAIVRSGKVVLGAFRDIQELPGTGRIEMIHRPVQVIAQGATVGSGMVPFDPDGTVRMARPVAQIGEKWLPSLALTTLEVILGQSDPLSLQPIRVVDFRRSRPEIPVFSIVDLLAGDVPASELAGRVVFVGATAPVLQDLWKTPVHARIPGVMIHAIEYRNYAADRAGQRPLSRAGLGLRFTLALLFSALMRWLGSGTHFRRVLAGAALCALTPVASLGLLVMGSVLVEPISALLVVILHYVWGIERLRIRFLERIQARDQSLGALVNIGKIASSSDNSRNVMALELLGKVTSANWLVLLPARVKGGFEPDPPGWARSGAPPNPDLGTARDSITAGAMQTAFSANGAEQELYVPLETDVQQIGVLVAGYPRISLPDQSEIDTIEAVAALIALAGTTDHLIRDLREATDIAVAANNAKTEFLANLSHEIRTPLNAVLGYTDLLCDPKIGAEQRSQMSEAMRLNGEHVVALVNDILDLSRIETGDLALKRKRICPVALGEEIVRMLSEQAQEKGIRLEFECSPRVPASIETDPVRLSQVLVNLIGNGIKFTDAGFVKLRVGRDDGSDLERGLLQFDVLDSGIGMEPDAQARVFEAFFQADGSSTRQRGGTGLGLAISRRLASLLGGSIEISSEPGRGSVFRLSVGVGVGPIGEHATPARSSKSKELPEGLCGRVLVAEDGLDNQRIIEMFLSKAGLDVTIAENGQLACEFAAQAEEAGEPFDMVFMDIAMPILDGHGATRRLRENGFTAPIVALTAHAQPEDREAALTAGCDEYMTKPVKRRQLVEMAACLLESRKTG